MPTPGVPGLVITAGQREYSLTRVLLFDSVSGQTGRGTQETLGKLTAWRRSPGSDSGRFLNRDMSKQPMLPEKQWTEAVLPE